MKKIIVGRKRLFSADLAPAHLELISSLSPLPTALLHQVNLDCGIRKEFAVLVTTSEVTDQLHCNERLLYSTVENENTTPSFSLPADKHLKCFLLNNAAPNPVVCVYSTGMSRKE